MSKLRQDVTYCLRTMARNPGFASIAVLSIALGIGVNTTLFSFVNAALFRPLPFPDSHRLVRLWDGPVSSYPDYVAYRDESGGVFSGLTAYSQRAMNLSAGDVTERVTGEIVTGNYFDVLGTGPAVGRAFSAEEDRTPTTHPVVVIGHNLWRRHFNADPRVVGRGVELNNHAYTVIGVMPEGFAGATVISPPDVWVPMMMEPLVRPGSNGLREADDNWLSVMGRLAPGVTPGAAQAAAGVVFNRLEVARRERGTGIRGAAGKVQTVSARGLMPPPEGRTTVIFVVGLLMAVVSLVLLVACANVANLLLARAAHRRKEIAVRLALGAGRRRVVRQLLTESVLLASIGGAGGLVLAAWSTDLIVALLPLSYLGDFDVPTVAPDFRVFAYTAALSALTGVVFGLAPALQASRADVVSTLKDETAALTAGRRRVAPGDLLVIAQIAVSILLLVGAGLFVRNFRNSQRPDPGFATDHALMMSFDLNLAGYDAARGRMFEGQLLERVRALPGVRRAALAELVPLSLRSNVSPIYVEGEPDDDRRFEFDSLLSHNTVGHDYFATMNIPLVRGRDFGPQDAEAGGPGVIIVNETLARRIAPGGDAIGKRMRTDPKGDYLEVIGVARDIKYRQLAEKPVFYGYRPLAQRYRGAMTLHVRTIGDPAAAIAAVRAEVRAFDAHLPLTNVKTMEEHMRAPLAPAKLFAWLSGAFGFLSLLLAAVGLYGLMAYGVSRRTREIGVRVALGARTTDVLRLVIAQGLLLAAIGTVIGLGAAFALTRVLSSLLYDVSPTDPATFMGVAALLLLVALAACYVPARRAAKVDPLVALRYE